MTRLKNGKIVFVQIIINDSRGNIGSRSVYSYANGTVGAKTEFYDYVYGTDADAGWKKLLTSYNGEAIDYDEIGNPIVYRDADLLWNGRQLRKYKADNFAETYFYNADGLRVRTKHYIKSGSSYEQTGETRYEYVGSSLAYQVTTNVNGAVEQELYFFYDASGNLSVIRQVTPTKDYHFYVTTNAQGDVLGIYSSTGILLASYEYDAWGNCTVSYDNPTYNIGATNPIRYRGYYYDSETKLYYLQSRYYDPEIGRFLNADGYITTGQGVLSYNMFAYCGNNPVINCDLSGTSILFAFFISTISTILVSAVGLCYYVNEDKKNQIDPVEKYVLDKSAEVACEVYSNVPECADYANAMGSAGKIMGAMTSIFEADASKEEKLLFNETVMAGAYNLYVVPNYSLPSVSFSCYTQQQYEAICYSFLPYFENEFQGIEGIPELSGIGELPWDQLSSYERAYINGRIPDCNSEVFLDASGKYSSKGAILPW